MIMTGESELSEQKTKQEKYSKNRDLIKMRVDKQNKYLNWFSKSLVPSTAIMKSSLWF